MRSTLGPLAVQVAVLLGVAALCAAFSNGLARPERRLAWRVAPPVVANAAALTLPAPIPTGALDPRPAPETAPLPPRAATPRDTSRPRPVITETFPPHPGQPIREISSEEAGQAFKDGVPFLDARRSAEYELGHVSGAWSLPIWESIVAERLIEFEARVNRPPEAALVLYCSGGSCEDSHLLASRLFQMGYRNLLIYTDGYPDWIQQGRPSRKGGAR